ncbi:bacillithiol transferase BstA [Joostella atrarenae]|uniref:Bacillithiol transferase BstA n=1 Tax=Joostella atrarenae TaxID=679257 RepID=A0ABS9J3G1_9FLAO|nr:bacillithiol transferase BstA [Joostella atrarenae]MCF8714972.1 bacillithiol transferase BstA [Joostella atrarenae]
MTIKEPKSLQYPIGVYESPSIIAEEDVKKWIKTIEFFPEKLESLVEDFDDGQLDTQYRPEGWTVRQLIHHLADSHMNSYIRFKWALTEDKPIIKAYYEDRWADLGDSLDGDIEMSLYLLEGLHKRWAYLLKHLSEDQLQRKLIHPENNKETTLKELIGVYAWHCKHHYAHIEELTIREDWV